MLPQGARLVRSSAGPIAFNFVRTYTDLTTKLLMNQNWVNIVKKNMVELVDMHGMSPLGSISKLGTRYLKSSEGVIGVLLCFKIRGTHIFFWWRFCMRGDPSGKKGTTSLYLHVLAADFHIMPYCFPMLSICPKPGHPVQRSSIIHELDYMPDIVSI